MNKKQMHDIIRAANNTALNSNMGGLLHYPETSESREACGLAIALEAMGEPFPDVPHCLMDGQHISELMPRIRAAVADSVNQ